MKKTLILAGILVVGYASAQQGNIGVNQETPKATLQIDVSATNLTNDTNQGIIIPKLTKTRVAAIADTKLVKGTLVFVEGTSYNGVNRKVSQITSDGFYHYDGTSWIKGVAADVNTTYTAGKGLMLTGTAFSVNPADITLGGDVTGNANANTVTKLQGKPISNTVPANGEILKYINDSWMPTPDNSLTTEVDGIIGNEVTDVVANRGLYRTGEGTVAAPYKIGISDGGVKSQFIDNNAVTSDKILDNTIVGNDLSSMGAKRKQVLTYTGTTWTPQSTITKAVNNRKVYCASAEPENVPVNSSYLTPDGVLTCTSSGWEYKGTLTISTTKPNMADLKATAESFTISTFHWARIEGAATSILHRTIDGLLQPGDITFRENKMIIIGDSTWSQYYLISRLSDKYYARINTMYLIPYEYVNLSDL